MAVAPTLAILFFECLRNNSSLAYAVIPLVLTGMASMIDLLSRIFCCCIEGAICCSRSYWLRMLAPVCYLAATAPLAIPPIVYKVVYKDESATIAALTMTVPATMLAGVLATAGCVASCWLCAASRAQSPRGTCCRPGAGNSSMMPTGARAGRTTDASTTLLSAADVV